MAQRFERVEISTSENGSITVEIFDYPTSEKGWKRLSGRGAHERIGLKSGTYSEEEIMKAIEEHYADIGKPMPVFDEVYDHRNDSED